MKGLIIAYGEKDSLGNDRIAEPRALQIFGGQPVIMYTLKRLREVDVDTVTVMVNPSQHDMFQKALGNVPCNVAVVDYHGEPDMFHAYFSGIELLGCNEPIIALADDNLIDFSLESIVHRSRQTGSNVVAVRNLRMIGEQEDVAQTNFGICTVDAAGKIIMATN